MLSLSTWKALFVDSRKQLLYFIGAVLGLAVHLIPALEPLKGDFLTVAEAGLALLAILITVEDSARLLSGNSIVKTASGVVVVEASTAKEAKAEEKAALIELDAKG